MDEVRDTICNIFRTIGILFMIWIILTVTIPLTFLVAICGIIYAWKEYKKRNTK